MTLFILLQTHHCYNKYNFCLGNEARHRSQMMTSKDQSRYYKLLHISMKSEKWVFFIC